jgi:hypothetical protein
MINMKLKIANSKIFILKISNILSSLAMDNELSGHSGFSGKVDRMGGSHGSKG